MSAVFQSENSFFDRAPKRQEQVKARLLDRVAKENWGQSSVAKTAKRVSYAVFGIIIVIGLLAAACCFLPEAPEIGGLFPDWLPYLSIPIGLSGMIPLIVKALYRAKVQKRQTTLLLETALQSEKVAAPTATLANATRLPTGTKDLERLYRGPVNPAWTPATATLATDLATAPENRDAWEKLQRNSGPVSTQANQLYQTLFLLETYWALAQTPANQRSGDLTSKQRQIEAIFSNPLRKRDVQKARSSLSSLGYDLQLPMAEKWLGRSEPKRAPTRFEIQQRVKALFVSMRKMVKLQEICQRLAEEEENGAFSIHLQKSEKQISYETLLYVGEVLKEKALPILEYRDLAGKSPVVMTSFDELLLDSELRIAGWIEVTEKVLGRPGLPGSLNAMQSFLSRGRIEAVLTAFEPFEDQKVRALVDQLKNECHELQEGWKSLFNEEEGNFIQLKSATSIFEQKLTAFLRLYRALDEMNYAPYKRDQFQERFCELRSQLFSALSEGGSIESSLVDELLTLRQNVETTSLWRKIRDVVARRDLAGTLHLNRRAPAHLAKRCRIYQEKIDALSSKQSLSLLFTNQGIAQVICGVVMIAVGVMPFVSIFWMQVGIVAFTMTFQLVQGGLEFKRDAWQEEKEVYAIAREFSLREDGGASIPAVNDAERSFLQRCDAYGLSASPLVRAQLRLYGKITLHQIKGHNSDQSEASTTLKKEKLVQTIQELKIRVAQKQEVERYLPVAKGRLKEAKEELSQLESDVAQIENGTVFKELRDFQKIRRMKQRLKIHSHLEQPLLSAKETLARSYELALHEANESEDSEGCLNLETEKARLLKKSSLCMMEKFANDTIEFKGELSRALEQLGSSYNVEQVNLQKIRMQRLKPDLVRRKQQLQEIRKLKREIEALESGIWRMERAYEELGGVSEKLRSKEEKLQRLGESSLSLSEQRKWLSKEWSRAGKVWKWAALTGQQLRSAQEIYKNKQALLRN